MGTQRERMLAGLPYDAADPELVSARRAARDLFQALNRTADNQRDLRQSIYRKLFGRLGADLWIESPFACDYGTNISLGYRVFFNFNCVVLDPAQVTIGDDVMIGPAVQIYTATHALDASARRAGEESAKPVRVGSDVWIGGGEILCPGVSIGDRSVIGAGSVVTRDVPADVFAAGNPCQIIRHLATSL